MVIPPLKNVLLLFSSAAIFIHYIYHISTVALLTPNVIDATASEVLLPTFFIKGILELLSSVGVFPNAGVEVSAVPFTPGTYFLDAG